MSILHEIPIPISVFYSDGLNTAFGHLGLSKYFQVKTGWWYTYPSEKWWSLSVGVTIPNIWKNKSHVPNHQPVEIWRFGDPVLLVMDPIPPSHYTWNGPKDASTKPLLDHGFEWCLIFGDGISQRGKIHINIHKLKHWRLLPRKVSEAIVALQINLDHHQCPDTAAS